MSLLQPAYAFRDDSTSATIDAPRLAATVTGDHLTRALSRASEAERALVEHRERIAHLEAQLLTDDLTGLYNRRGFLDQLREEIKRCADAPENAGHVVVVDLDGFRQLNDRFGHPVGDAYLRRAGLTLCASLRPRDVIARLGGDEFGLLLTETMPDAAARLVDGIIERFHVGSLAHGDCIIPLRGSFGWHPYRPGDEPRTVLAAADRALSQSRRIRFAAE